MRKLESEKVGKLESEKVRKLESWKVGKSERSRPWTSGSFTFRWVRKSERESERVGKRALGPLTHLPYAGYERVRE